MHISLEILKCQGYYYFIILALYYTLLKCGLLFEEESIQCKKKKDDSEIEWTLRIYMGLVSGPPVDTKICRCSSVLYKML